MPATQHAASVGIIPALNRKIATAAPHRKQQCPRIDGRKLRRVERKPESGHRLDFAETGRRETPRRPDWTSPLWDRSIPVAAEFVPVFVHGANLYARPRSLLVVIASFVVTLHLPV